MKLFEVQDLDYIRVNIRARIKSNKRQGFDMSLSGLFKMARNNSHISFIGDYPVLTVVIEEMLKAGYEIDAGKIKRASFYSKEYKGLRKKDKMEWAKSLQDVKETIEKKQGMAKPGIKKAGNTPQRRVVHQRKT